MGQAAVSVVPQGTRRCRRGWQTRGLPLHGPSFGGASSRRCRSSVIPSGSEGPPALGPRSPARARNHPHSGDPKRSLCGGRPEQGRPRGHARLRSQIGQRRVPPRLQGRGRYGRLRRHWPPRRGLRAGRATGLNRCAATATAIVCLRTAIGHSSSSPRIVSVAFSPLPESRTTVVSSGRISPSSRRQRTPAAATAEVGST